MDLLKIARTITQRQHNRVGKGQQSHSGKLRLVLDGECCLDRLYGGYFTGISASPFFLAAVRLGRICSSCMTLKRTICDADWACGGQWNRMLQFLAVLIQATEMSGLELAVFFNGCFESPRLADWVLNQLQVRIKVNNVSFYQLDSLKASRNLRNLERLFRSRAPENRRSFGIN